jgi:hypothetical protein
MKAYLGEDLILATGAPGSGWSGVLRTISFADEINNSDLAADNIYHGPSVAGSHFGTYFGPGEKYGPNFDNLKELSKDQLLSEFGKPFAGFERTKIIKSHQFAHHLDYLHSLFPKARFVCVFRETDELTFAWWHRCGGWGITHPKYTWYRDDERMKRQIALENSAVRKFATRRGLRVFNCVLDTASVFAFLGLTFTRESLKEPPFGSPEAFAKLNSDERFYKVKFGTSLNGDPFMYTAVL